MVTSWSSVSSTCSGHCQHLLVLWQPQIVKTLGLTNQQVGFINAIPFIVGIIAMLLWGRHADRYREYRMHLALACIVAGAGLAKLTSIHSGGGQFLPGELAGFHIASRRSVR
jgi:MFS family permease